MGYNHSIEEQIFPTSLRDNFQRIIMRAAGDDNYPADHAPANAGSAHIRDAYIHMLADQGGLNLDVRRAVKYIIYLNGAYWGVYDLEILMSTILLIIIMARINTIYNISKPGVIRGQNTADNKH